MIWSVISVVAGYRTLPARQLKPAPANQPTFSTDVRVVNVFATVRDKQGKIVRGLSKDDFTLEEDNRPETIRYFSQQTDLPLTLGLLVDTSMSERRMLGEERDASQTFLEQVLRPEKDKAFLIHFDREVELLQELTSSRQQLEKALSLINQAQWGGVRETATRIIRAPEKLPTPRVTVVTAPAGVVAAAITEVRPFMMRFTWHHMISCRSNKGERR